MTRNLRFIALTLTLGCVLAAPALALGPVDGEVSALWWDNEWTTTDGAVTSTADAAAPGYRATLWLRNKYGFRAEQFGSEPDTAGASGTDYTSLDVMWRAFAPTETSFVAVGLGWQQMDLGDLGPDADTSGVRLSVETRLGITKRLAVLGTGAYFPSLDDAATSGGFGSLEDLDGYQAEFGVAWQVAPAVSLATGYRLNSLDYKLMTDDPLAGAMVETTSGAANSGDSLTLNGPGGGGPGCGCSQVVLAAGGTAESEGLFLGLTLRF